MTMEKPTIHLRPRVINPASRGTAVPRQFQFAAPERSADTPDFYKQYRQQAQRAFDDLPIPDTSLEAWRRTDLRALPAANFKMAGNAMVDLPPVPERLLEPLADEEHGGQIILTPKESRSHLAEELKSRGVIFSDLSTALRENPQVVKRILGSVVRPDEGKFAALAGAYGQYGAVLYVPRNVRVDVPLHSLIWGPGANLAYATHLLVLLEEGASATYVHEAASPTEPGTHTLHAGIVEIKVGPRAELKFVELQSWGESVWNFSHERAVVDEEGKLDWIFGAIGSRLTKNFSEFNLEGRFSTGKMSGFYFTDKQQHLDHDTQQNHFAADTTSDLLFKGALIQESRSVWQGMIYVSPDAQRADGYQANRNLVLSRKARADSIPGLEILANDVRCTHGATVGKIDEEQVFYMMARGIPRQIAERSIVEGFFDPIMGRIPFEGVKQRFQRTISEKMRVFDDDQKSSAI